MANEQMSAEYTGMTRRRVVASIANGAGAGTLLASCGTASSRDSGAPAPIAAPVSLVFLTDGDIEGQKQLFGRFTQQQPKVTFEFSPNPPGQAARDRVKIMHQAGTPADLWESARAAFGDLLLLGAIASLSAFIKRD